MQPTKTLCGFALALALLGSASSASSFQLTLDSGSGAVTLTDDDLDGVIDFDTTVGGVFLARGRAFEQVRSDKTIVSLAATPPSAEAVLRNTGAVDATFTITVDSTAFVAIGPPLGWSVFYTGRTSDSAAGAVNVSSHSVQALTHNGALSLTTLAGAASAAAEDFSVSSSGVNASDSGTDLRVVYRFTLAPDDEIRLADNSGADGDAIQVNLFNQQAKCVDKMNSLARKLLDTAQKTDAGCVKAGAKAGGADETACVDNVEDEKTNSAETKMLDGYEANCANNLPPWGVNADRCCEGGSNDGDACVVNLGCPGGACRRGACASGAAEQAANDLSHDLFGASVAVTDGGAIGMCQGDVSGAAGKLIVERWKTFRSCKKDNFAAIANDVDLVATCLASPQQDPKGKIAKLQTRLADTVQAKCVDKGVSPLGTAFAGPCGSIAEEAVATCFSSRASCRFCLAVNVADDIDPPVDCDLFDDATPNGTCP